MGSGNRSAIRMSSPVAWPTLAAIALGVLAVITSVWAVISHNEAETLEREVLELRANANASMYVMDPTDSAPTATQGQVFISLSGSGVVMVSNLPQPGDNEEFRLWYLQDNDDTAMAGGSLTVSETGQGFALIPADTTNYSRIAVSLEPSGSEVPGGSFLLIGEVRSGRG